MIFMYTWEQIKGEAVEEKGKQNIETNLMFLHQSQFGLRSYNIVSLPWRYIINKLVAT